MKYKSLSNYTLQLEMQDRNSCRCLQYLIRLFLYTWYVIRKLDGYPANTTRWNNDGLMLDHRLRRWPNLKTFLFQRVVIAGIGPICVGHVYITMEALGVIMIRLVHRAL